MGYGYGPGAGKPSKKPVQPKKPVNKPAVEKPQSPVKPKKGNPAPFPFDFGKFLPGYKWKK